MRTKVSRILSIAILATLLPGSVLGQSPPPHRVVVFRHAAPAISGFLNTIDGDTLEIESDSLYRVPRRAVERVRLLAEESGYPSAVSLGFMTGYLLTLASSQWEPFALVTQGSAGGVVSEGIAGFLLGTALGRAFSTSTSDDRDFQPGHQLDWEELVAAVSNRGSRVHFSVLMAQTTTPVQNRMDVIARQNGTTPQSPYDYFSYGVFGSLPDYSGYPGDRSTAFNLFRRFEITYDVRPTLQIGVAIVGLSEPTMYWYGDSGATSYPDTNAYERQIGIEQDVRAMGYVALARFITPTTLSGLNLTAGIGLGVADISSNRNYTKTLHSYNSVLQTVSRSTTITKVVPMAIPMASIGFELNRYTSLSISGDYAILSPITTEAIPELKLSTQQLEFGNASLGVSLNFRF